MLAGTATDVLCAPEMPFVREFCQSLLDFSYVGRRCYTGNNEI